VEDRAAASADARDDRPPSDSSSRSERVRVDASPAGVSSITVAAKLRVTGTQMEHMPLYLRVFFRVLSSWVHHPKPQVSGPFPSPLDAGSELLSRICLALSRGSLLVGGLERLATGQYRLAPRPRRLAGTS
jgi:hypothetical protein